VKFITDFGKFWYDFIIGDDWTIAALIVVTLIVIALLAHAHLQFWWLLVVVVVLALGASVWRAAQSA
jgi:hypothetical protein